MDVIVPVFNEEEVLVHLLYRLGETFSEKHCREHGIERCRIIFVDDGSTDSTASSLAEKIAGGFPGSLIRLSRNFGHQSAVSCGLDAASADVVAIIDADLQDPPELIFEMLAQWRLGYHVIFGQRRNRKESAFLRLCYWGFYRLINLLAETATANDSGDFCLMDRAVVAAMRRLPERLRYLRGLRSWVGFRQVGLPYDRPARAAGDSKYSLRKLYKLATDGIASTSTRPLKFLQFIAFSLFVTTCMATAYILWSGEIGVSTLTSFSMLSASIQMFGLYILGAYIGRTYLEVKQRPSYIVMEVVEGPIKGFADDFPRH